MKPEKILSKVTFKKPPELNFFKRLTDRTGIIQHAKFAVPDRNFGYSVDDNARALIVAVLYYKLFGDEDILDYAVTYLSYTQHSKTEDNWFYNFMNYEKKFLDHAKTEDGFGRCFWALGYTVYAAVRRDLTLSAKHLLNELKPNIRKLKSPRAKAYTLAGLYYLFQAENEDEAIKNDIKFLADEFVKLYKKYSKPSWRWFENYLTYSNAIFPYALILAYQVTEEDIYCNIAKEALEFLDKETTTKEGIPSPIGQDGWYFRGKNKATYDQQPVEAADMVIAFLAVYKICLSPENYQKALKWFAWYHGYNIKKVSVYDPVTKGCFDGINAEGINLNQGAESIITYLLAYLVFSDIELKTTPKKI